jgi:acetyl-CoA acetyltransferase
MSGERPSRTPVVAGIGESKFSRRAAVPFRILQTKAIERALADAAIAPAQIDAVFTESALMPMLYPLDVVEAAFGLHQVSQRAYFGSVGPGVALSIKAAMEGIRTGTVSAALVYFGVNWGSAQGSAYDFHGKYESKTAVEVPYGFYAQPTYFALMARRYAHDYGMSLDELADVLGRIAVRQRGRAALNDNAQQTKPLTMEGYLSGRMISDPLRLYDCCLLSDGAVALVISSLDRARDSGRRDHAALLGAGYARTGLTEESCLTQGAAYPAMPAARRSAELAFKAAGVTAADVSFAEIYDCFTISVLLQLDQLGLCHPGESRYLIPSAPDDPHALPVNTHGGLLSQAYILGVNHITEAVRQVRNEAGRGQLRSAEIGVVQLAPSADHATLVLGRGR